MNAIDFVTIAAQVGGSGETRPLPALDSPELWPVVVDLAVKHNVAPLLFEALSRTPELALPKGIREGLWAQVLRSSATRLLCETTLADVIGILRARGVEVIVLKGPTVAHSLYPRPELRMYHDLDVLCRVTDYPALHAAFSASGYTSAGTLEARGSHDKLVDKPSPSESHSVRGFYDRSGDMKIEVHFDALQLGLLDKNEQTFWRRSGTLDVGGVEIRMLAPEHQFLHLALHAHRHCYSRLSWLIELDLLVRREFTRMDWDLLIQTARDEGVGTAIRHALVTLQAVLDTPWPALPAPTLEERCLGACYRALWPIQKTRSLNSHESHRLLHFLPDDADPRNVLYGLVLMGRRREKLHALLRRRWSSS
ncbi:MAG: nucleotidyltransferase family protein [Pseudomonadota bacterium]